MAASAQNSPDIIDKVDRLPNFDELKVQTEHLVAQASHTRRVISHYLQIVDAYRDERKTKIALGFMQKTGESISSLLNYRALAAKNLNEIISTLDASQTAEIRHSLDDIDRMTGSATSSFNRKGSSLRNMQVKLKDSASAWTNCCVSTCEFYNSGTPQFSVMLLNTTTAERTQLALTDNLDERLSDTDEVVQASRDAVRLTFKYGLADKEIMNVINHFPAADAIGTIDTGVNINGGLSDTNNNYTHFTFFDRDEDPSLEDHEKAFFHPSHQFTVETKRINTKAKDGTEKTMLQVIGVEPVGFSIHPKFQKDLNTSFKGKALTEEAAAQITEKLLFLHQHGIQPDQVREKEPKATKLSWANSSSTDRRVARLSDPNTTLDEDEDKTDEVRAKYEAEEAGITKPGIFARTMNWLGKTRVGKFLPAFLFANSAIAVGGTTDTAIMNRAKPEEPTEPSTPTRWDRWVQRASETRLGKWFPSLFANNKLIMAGANPTPPADNSDITIRAPEAERTTVSKRKMGLAGLAAAAALAALFGIRHANHSPELHHDASRGAMGNEGTDSHGNSIARNNEAIAARQSVQLAQTNYIRAVQTHGAQSAEAKAAATVLKNAQIAQQNVLASIADSNNNSTAGNNAQNPEPTPTAPVATPTPSTQGPATIVIPVGTDSGDVNGGTAAHPDRHNDSLERFFVHGASQVIQLADQGLTPAQETRAAGTIGHLLQQRTDSYLAGHPAQAHRFGQIHHGDHGNMTVELATRPHGHGTQEVFHIQLHRADRHGVDHVVLDLNIPKDEVNNVLSSHGHHGISHDSHANGHRLVTHPRPHHVGTSLHVSNNAGHTDSAHTDTAVRTAAPRGRNEGTAAAPIATTVAPALVGHPTTTAVDAGTQQSALPAAVVVAPAPTVAADAGAPQAVPEVMANTVAVVHPEPQNQPRSDQAPAARQSLQESVRPAAGQPIERVASARTIERTVDSFDHLSNYQKEALRDFVLAFNEHIPSLHRERTVTHGPLHDSERITETVSSIAASISYDNANRPTLNIDIIGMPGTVRQRQIRAEVPFTVVRRADGSIDLETDDRPVVLPRATETNLRANITTSRRMVPTLASELTDDQSLMAREEFAPNHDRVGPVDSIQDINASISPSIVGFGIEQATNPDEGFHLEQQNAGVYNMPRVGTHTPMERALTYILSQVRHVTLTPGLTLQDHFGRREVINPVTTVRVAQPFVTHPNTTNGILAAFTQAVRAHLNTRPFQTTPRTPAQPFRQVAPAAQPAPAATTTPDNDPLGLGDLGLKAENTVINSNHDVAIAADTAAYDALMKDISDHFGHTDPSQQA